MILQYRSRDFVLKYLTLYTTCMSVFHISYNKKMVRNKSFLFSLSDRAISNLYCSVDIKRSLYSAVYLNSKISYSRWVSLKTFIV